MDMDISTSRMVLSILVAIWFLTLGRSIVIMIGGRKIFKKASKGEKTAFYPIINLFTMLEIADISTFLGILLFIPVINIVILIMMSYKLGTVFKTSFMYKIGLVVFPLMFYPLLGISNKQYKLSDEEYFKALDSARGESINLMTEEEIKKVNEEEPKDTVQVDSIFKSDIELMEKVAPYKAVKIDLLGMNKLQTAEKMDMNDLMRSSNQTSPQPTPQPQQPTTQTQPVQEAQSSTENKDNLEMIDL